MMVGTLLHHVSTEMWRNGLTWYISASFWIHHPVLVWWYITHVVATIVELRSGTRPGLLRMVEAICGCIAT